MGMKKGIAIIYEVIVASVILIALFNFFFSWKEFESRWDEVLLKTKVIDALVVVDRMGKLWDFINDADAYEDYLGNALPPPYVWWSVVVFSNGTQIDLIKFKNTRLSAEGSYVGVAKVDIFYSSFEEGIGTDAFYWNEGRTFSRDNTFSFRGTYSLKSEITNSFDYSLSDPIEVRPFEQYLLSGWIYNNLTSGSVYIDLNNVIFECEAISRQKQVWEYVSCPFIVPADVDQVEIRLVVDARNGVGEVWFDDIRIQEFQVYELRLIAGYPF